MHEFDLGQAVDGANRRFEDRRFVEHHKDEFLEAREMVDGLDLSSWYDAKSSALGEKAFLRCVEIVWRLNIGATLSRVDNDRGVDLRAAQGEIQRGHELQLSVDPERARSYLAVGIVVALQFMGGNVDRQSKLKAAKIVLQKVLSKESIAKTPLLFQITFLFKGGRQSLLDMVARLSDTDSSLVANEVGLRLRKNWIRAFNEGRR
jgi:hypothetical protein